MFKRRVKTWQRLWNTRSMNTWASQDVFLSRLSPYIWHVVCGKQYLSNYGTKNYSHTKSNCIPSYLKKYLSFTLSSFDTGREQHCLMGCFLYSCISPSTFWLKSIRAMLPHTPPFPLTLGTLLCGTSCWFIFLHGLSASCLNIGLVCYVLLFLLLP